MTDPVDVIAEAQIKAAAKALCRLSYPMRTLEEVMAPGCELWMRLLPEAKIAVEASNAALSRAGYVVSKCQPAEPVAWQAMDESPHGIPILAQHRLWNKIDGALAEHVVWFYNGEWRIYPQTGGTAFVNRWKHLPTAPPASKEPRFGHDDLPLLDTPEKIAAFCAGEPPAVDERAGFEAWWAIPWGTPESTRKELAWASWQARAALSKPPKRENG